LGSQRLAHSGCPLTPPGAEKRRVQSFAAQQRSDAAGAFGTVGFQQDTLLVVGSKGAPLGLGHDFGIGMGLGGAGFAVCGSSVGLAWLVLPTSRRRQSRWGGRKNLIVVHYENLSRPAL
jgi:hypothetical protein